MLNLYPADDKYSFDLYKDRYEINKNGIIYDTVKNRFVSIVYSGKHGEYPKIRLVSKDGIENLLVLHKLLASLFIPKPNKTEKLYVNHIDGNKRNFSLTNLEWVTSSENIQHGVNTGLIDKTKYINQIPKDINKNDIYKIEIINLILSGYSNDDIADKYGLHSRYISCVRGKSKYKHIWDKYYPNVIPPPSNKTYVRQTLHNRKHDNATCVKIMEELRYSKNNVVANKYGLDPSIMHRVRLRMTWEELVTIHMNKYIIPLPYKPLEYVTLPYYLLSGDKELRLSIVINIIYNFLKTCDLTNISVIQELNWYCGYWCVIQHDLPVINAVISYDHFETLLNVLRPLLQ